MKHKLELTDVVSVNFHRSKFTLCRKAILIKFPTTAGDNWIFKDVDTNQIHYISEGCTVTSIKEE